MGDPVPAQADGAAGPGRQAMTATVLRGLSRFADMRGIPADAEFLPGYDVIEAFLRRRPPRAGVVHLRHLPVSAVSPGAPVHGPPGQRATPFAGAAAPAPYSANEQAELAAAAAAQRDPAKRRSALAIAVFGIGAGLRPGELVALCGSDVGRRGRQVVVEVSGAATRVVPVTSCYAARAAELARGAGNGHLFRPGPADRGYKNVVTSFARNLAADPAVPRLTVSRCRASFICAHLAAGTPLRELLAITGICQAESLARYARHIDGAPSKAFLRAWDKGQQAR